MKKSTEVLVFSENEYSQLLDTARTQINTARNTLALHVNTTVITTYWNLGKLLHDKKIESGYGTQVVERLSADLKSEFSDKELLLNAIKMDSYSLNKSKYRDNNFTDTLPVIQAKKANEILRDSYNLGFLGITEPVAELELEKRIIENAVSDYELIIPRKELQTLVLNEIKQAEIEFDAAKLKGEKENGKEF